VADPDNRIRMTFAQDPLRRGMFEAHFFDPATLRSLPGAGPLLLVECVLQIVDTLGHGDDRTTFDTPVGQMPDASNLVARCYHARGSREADRGM